MTESTRRSFLQHTALASAEANRLLTRTYRQGGHWSVPRNA